MPARKKQHIPLNRAHTVYYPVCPRGDLMWQLTSRTTITKQVPIRTLCTDLNTAATLILAVVPFNKIPIDFGRRSEAS
jgi:hypothetical protein